LKYTGHVNDTLSVWIKSVGITKHITFHSFRHTYATLQLSLGTDIYTVSKLLGHKDIKTTQIYAKVIDQLKRTAADKIKLFSQSDQDEFCSN
jgi:site-specific recombinase XerD